MSSYLRSIQKRSLKRQGWSRQTERVEMRNGQPTIVKLKAGEGQICTPQGEPTNSKRWPIEWGFGPRAA